MSIPSTGQLIGQSNFNQNYELMAKHQITAMHAAIQGNSHLTSQLFGQSNFNHNYALMAQQQMAAMHAAIQGNSHQIRRGFPNNFPSSRFHYLNASSFNGGKLPFNIAPLMAAAYKQIKRPQQHQNSTGSVGPQGLSPTNGCKLPGNKGLSIDDLMKQVYRQTQGREIPETNIQNVDN